MWSRGSTAVAAILLLAALVGCKETPTSVLLRIESGSGLPTLDELRLSVLEEAGVAVNDRRIPESGAPTLPGTLVLYPKPSSATIRVLCRARKAGLVVGEGATTVALQAGAQVSAAVNLIPGRLPDSDGDGVPDAIDNCPALPNPAQAPCARSDGAADAPRDAAVDRALDANPETAPTDLAPDRWRDLPPPDARPPDGKPHDTQPADARPPDVKPPDVKPPSKITVTAPVAGAVWAAGTAHTIQWTTTGAIPMVTIDLYRGGAKVSTIASGLANTGTWSWSIPATLSYATNNVVRVSDVAAPAVFGESGLFTIANWRFAAPVTINATGVSSSLASYQVLVTLTPSFDYASAKSDGSDLRFSTGSTLGSPFLPHYLESWKAGSPQKSKLWVRVPMIAAGSTSTIYLFYGNTAAGIASNLAAAFPQSFVSTGDLTLTGSQSYDRFELAAGHTLKLQAGAPLTISARQILIVGSIDGLGAGHAGGAVSYGAGLGPGAGQALNAEAGGGGGHGGAGGAGGHDGATAAAGGPAYGSSTDETNQMGSGGGGTDLVVGGGGGGALTLAGTDLAVTGAIGLAGAAGTMSTPGRGSGGGAGGGLLLKGDTVQVSSAISLSGGDGGTATNTGWDGGGGGGGGRYKVFYQTSYSATGASSSVAGGVGGCTAAGQQTGIDGAAGSTQTGQKPLGIPTTSVGAGTPL